MKGQEVFRAASGRLSCLKQWGETILAETLAVPTVSPEGRNYFDFVTLVSDRLDAVGLKAEIHKVPDELVMSSGPVEAKGNPRYILVARTGHERPIFHMNCHYDVVPGGYGWTVTQPFTPVIRDGRAYGRGSTDMKGGIASALMTLLSLSECADLPGSLEVALVPDEEVGAKCGTIYMLDSGIVRPDFAVIAEPTGKDNLIIGHKGNVWTEVIVEGKTAHGSTPWLGVNAFEGMLEVAKTIGERLKPQVESKTSRYAYDIPGGERATLLMGGTARVEGKINQVPGMATFSIDRGVLPDEDMQSAEAELRQFVEELGAKIRLVSATPPCLTSAESASVRAFSEAAKHELGVSASPKVYHAGLDMGFYVSRGYECLTFGPGDLGLAHSANESICLGDIHAFSRVFARAAVSLLYSSD